MYKEVFSERIKNAREENMLTQEEASKRLNISQSTLCLYEAGKREPNIETIGKMAKLYCHTTDYFLGLADD